MYQALLTDKKKNSKGWNCAMSKHIKKGWSQGSYIYNILVFPAFCRLSGSLIRSSIISILFLRTNVLAQYWFLIKKYEIYEILNKIYHIFKKAQKNNSDSIHSTLSTRCHSFGIFKASLNIEIALIGHNISSFSSVSNLDI